MKDSPIYTAFYVDHLGAYTSPELTQDPSIVSRLGSDAVHVVKVEDYEALNMKFDELNIMFASMVENVGWFLEQVTVMRKEWLRENDPQDGTDCLTPFDVLLYGTGTPSKDQYDNAGVLVRPVVMVEGEKLCYDCRVRLGYTRQGDGVYTAVLSECTECGKVKPILDARYWVKGVDDADH